MICILDVVEVVLGDDTEGSCISTEDSTEKLEIVFLLLGYERDTDLRTHYFLELSTCKDDLEGLDIVKTQSEGVDEDSVTSGLGVTSDIHKRALAVRNRGL